MTQNERALCFFDLPQDLDRTMFRYELENYGAVKRLQFAEKPGKPEIIAYASFLYDSDSEKLYTKTSRLTFCGLHLKVRWGYFPDE